MTWTVPITAVSGALFPAASYNQAVRDNFIETMPAKTTTLGSFFATVGINQIDERVPGADSMTDLDTTASLTYTDLANGAGPTVTAETGTMAAVFIYGNQSNNDSPTAHASWLALEISGATSQAASDNFAVQFQGPNGQRAGAGFLIDSLVPGLNTFTLKYRVSTSGTGIFSARRVAVWPF